MAAAVMHRYECLACHGVYSSTNEDGTIYHHACSQVLDADSGDLVDRPGHRDENIENDRRGRAIGIRAEGAGVKPVDPSSPAEPVWLTKLKHRTSKSEHEV